MAALADRRMGKVEPISMRAKGVVKEDKPLGRLCMICNSFFYEFRVIL
jgi:hypothetical protein